MKDHNGIEVVFDRTNGGIGRINSIKIYHHGTLIQNTHIGQGGEISNYTKNK